MCKSFNIGCNLSELIEELRKDIVLFESLPSLLLYAQNCGHSFAAWKLPDAPVVHLVVAEKVETFEPAFLETKKSGFVFAPFNHQKYRSVFLPADIYLNSEGVSDWNQKKDDFKSQIYNEVFVSKPTSSKGINTGFELMNERGAVYVNNVANAILAIENGYLRKVVLSDCHEYSYEEIDVCNVFQRLCEQTNAFVSMVYVPEIGLHIGASPEVLVRTKGSLFNTVSLAGTQKYKEGLDLNAASWTQKEIEEQALVSRYIIECFKKIRLREYDDIGPKTVRAGNILHLKTEFWVDMQAVGFYELPAVMLGLLHPTSAICGMPLEPAKQFIMDSEQHDRGYFCGYLGPININESTNIYVNIRCAKVDFAAKSVTFYAGAGITQDSIPEKELAEIHNKMVFLKGFFGVKPY